MDGMVINNLSPHKQLQNADCCNKNFSNRLLSKRKQKGITESLMKRLASKKIDIISDMYGNVHVTHDNFGGC